MNSLMTDAETSAATARAFYEFSPHVCFVLDASARIMSINARGSVMLGYAPEDLEGVNVCSLVPQEHHSLLLAQLDQALRNPGQMVSAEFACAGKGGCLLRVRQQVLAPPPTDGTPFVLAVWMDVSDEHRARLALAAEQARVQALALESTLTEERERRRLSVALHDEIGQRLALVRLAIVRERTIGGGGQRAADLLLDLIDESIAVTRSLTSDLSSPVLYELGLEPALRSLCDRTGATQHLATNFGVEGQDNGLREGASVLLYRAARELIHNAVKHACATRLDVHLRYRDTGVTLLVADDGHGCSPEHVGASSGPAGFGLFSLRQQLQPLGGSLQIQSCPGAGTRIEVTVPW